MFVLTLYYPPGAQFRRPRSPFDVAKGGFECRKLTVSWPLAIAINLGNVGASPQGKEWWMEIGPLSIPTDRTIIIVTSSAVPPLRVVLPEDLSLADSLLSHA